MKKLNLIYLLICTLIFGACKDDTFGDYGDYSEGQPATLVGSIKVPSHKKIASRAMGAERETAIEQLALIAWEINSGRKMAIDLTGKLRNKSWTDKGTSVYELTEPIAVLTGHYRVYFVANWKSFYARKENTNKGPELTFEELSNMTEDELKQVIFWNYGDHIDLYGNDGFPMTQVIDYYEINDDTELGKPNKLTGVNLTRASAHIHFKIYNGNQGLAEGEAPTQYTGDNVPNFVPQRYAVFRVPQRTNAFKEGESQVEILKESTFDSDYVPITAQPDAEGENYYEFDFHMLENRQPVKEGLNSIADRERWDESSTTPNVDLGKATDSYAAREFTNAPAGATFVVIEGTYSGPAETDHKTPPVYDNKKYIGNVTYIIHLGNFGKTDLPNHSKSYGDFSVLRNELHEITIRVLGAHQIKINVDVTDPGEENQAVEGDLSCNPIADLDSHYSKIMMQIDLNSIKENLEENKVAITSYKNGFNNTLYTLNQLETPSLDIDYKWVQFQKPTNGLDKFPNYAGSPDGYMPYNDGGNTGNGFGYITDLIRDLAAYKADKTHQLRYAVVGSDGNLYTAAFVDENVYNLGVETTTPIRAWAGLDAKDRRLALNPDNRLSSPSGASVLSGVSSINIRQKPVISPYSLVPTLFDNSNYNPFGFEHELTPTATIKSLENESLRPIVNGITLKTDNDKDYYETYRTRYDGKGYWWDSPITITDDQKAVYADISETNSQKNTVKWFPAFENGGVEDELDSFYKLDTETNAYEFVPADDYNSVTKALVVHNRDIDGNGKITAEELRWYIPGYVQLLIFSYADNLIPETERLQSRAMELAIDKEFSTVSNFDLVFPRYLTSSNHIRRVYWHEQRGASSYLNRPDVDTYNSEPSKRFTPQINHIRFVRNLGQFKDATTAHYTYMSQHNMAGTEEDQHNVRYLNQNISRNYNVIGFYPFHYCTDEFNLLPRAQEYNTELLRLWGGDLNDGFDPQNLMKGGATSEAAARASQQAIYDRVIEVYEKKYNIDITDGKLPDGWRVPNQRELLSLFVVNAPATLLRTLRDKEENRELSSDEMFDEYIKAIFLTCSFVRPDLYSTRYNRAFVLSGGVMTLPSDGYTRENGYVILVRDIDPDTGDPIVESKAVEYSARVGRGILKR